jgi:ribonuclease HII
MAKMQRKLPDFELESELYKRGFKVIAGVDEVGRGCFAGPVVAGCVIFSKVGPVEILSRHTSLDELIVTRQDSLRFRHPPIIINDSKKLSAKQRQQANEWIRENALSFGVGSASVSQINKLGIKKATEIAFRKAIKNASLNAKIDHLLIDAFHIPYVRGLKHKYQTPIIKGDSKSFSIAAASIVAKVYRDGLMVNLSRKEKYYLYGWDQNKGYGTKKHRDNILKYGISSHHRIQFVNTWLNKKSD